MEKDVKMRIREVLREFSSNPTQLANQFDVNQKTLNSHINGDTSVSLSTILLILDAFPDVSAEWLLRGTGEMTSKNTFAKNYSNIKADDLDQQELLGLCKALVANYQQRDEVMAKLVSMVNGV